MPVIARSWTSYKFCGDYAGFAQVDLEAAPCRRPGDVRRRLRRRPKPDPSSHARLWPWPTANSSPKASKTCSPGRSEPIDGPIKTSYEEIALAFASLPTKDQIERDTASDNFYVASRASHLLKTIESRGRLDSTYPYPVAVWRLGGLTWVFLGGEVVVDYALRIKRNLGSSHTWVSAYCNDVMAYIPSQRVLKEGGYEGGGAMVYYGQPAIWSDEVEETIIAAVARRLHAVGP